MGKNIKRLFLAAGLLAMTGILLTGCGSKKKNAEDESVIKISMAPEPTATPDPKTVDPDAVTTNGNLTMVNEYLAENGGAALGLRIRVFSGIRQALRRAFCLSAPKSTKARIFTASR